MVCSTDRQEFQAMSSLRKFHSIAALCGDGLRPELHALFERLAVDPRTELFARNDGMLQSGPDSIAEEASRQRAIGETTGANADGTRDVVISKKRQSSN
jgi:hypothetical protein